jgi:hypothetical protein
MAKRTTKLPIELLIVAVESAIHAMFHNLQPSEIRVLKTILSNYNRSGELTKGQVAYIAATIDV